MNMKLMGMALAFGVAAMTGCGGVEDAVEAPVDEAVVAPVEVSGDVSQQELPVCGSGLDCRGYYVSGSYTCVQYPGSTRAVYCCPSGQKVYYNDAGYQFCA